MTSDGEGCALIRITSTSTKSHVPETGILKTVWATHCPMLVSSVLVNGLSLWLICCYWVKVQQRAFIRVRKLRNGFHNCLFLECAMKVIAWQIYSW